MIRSKNRAPGQALVETLVLVPTLLIILAGILALGNHLSMLSIAESAAHSEALRIARKQPGCSAEWNRLLPAAECGFRFDQAGKKITGSLFPLPLSLDGRTTVSTSLDRPWDPSTQGMLGWDRQRLSRTGIVSGDCWNAASPSGGRIRRAVTVLVATGAL